MPFHPLPATDERPDAPTGTVYLLHFETPYAHAKHYLGWAEGGDAELAERLRQHQSGTGAKLMAVIVNAGITFQLARTFRNVTRWRERQLKNQGGKSRMCPLCKGRPPILE